MLYNLCIVTFFTSILCIAILYWRMACCSLDSIYGSGNDSYLSLYFQLL